MVMGISGIGAQVLLLRELLISFLGNELTIGIILSNWLLLVAIGSYFIGKSVEKVEKRIELFVFFQLLFSVALPFSVYLARTFKNILVVTPGEVLGFAPILYSSFLILLPVTLLHGARFTYGCKLYAQRVREDASSVGKVYFFESTGAIIGGLLMTFLLIRYLNSFEIAFIISLINALAAATLVWPAPRSSNRPVRTVLWVLSVLLSLVFAFCLLPQASGQIHYASTQSQWKGLDVIHNENSVYGNITVTKKGEQFTFFTDGFPSITAPVPDIAWVEDFAHFSMLFHGKPESVLVLSGGAGGLIREILKYPVHRLDYVELDPLLLNLVRRFPTPLTESELTDPRIRIHFMDGRLFVTRTRDRFDVVLIGLSAPRQLQSNRLFTSEFLHSVRKRMRPGGLIAVSSPGSLTYISPELRDLNGCLADTLGSVFRSVRVIPGDVNFFLASDSPELPRVTSEELVGRFKAHGIVTSLFNARYIQHRLNERWLRWFSDSMVPRENHVNSDFHPLGVYFNLSYWNALFSPDLSRFLGWLGRSRLKVTVVLTAGLILLIAILSFKRPRAAGFCLPYSIFATGLAVMVINLAIPFAFQTLFGFLYHQIGLLIALFMAGVALGSLFMTRLLDRIKKSLRLFSVTECCMVLYAILLPLALSWAATGSLKTPAAHWAAYSIFLALSFLSGLILGLQFPLATKIYLESFRGNGALGHAAGLLYGADLLGGFLGGLLGGVFFFPVLGLKVTCFMMAILKMSSLILILLFAKIRRS
jgi:spermidine synthase